MFKTTPHSSIHFGFIFPLVLVNFALPHCSSCPSVSLKPFPKKISHQIHLVTCLLLLQPISLRTVKHFRYNHAFIHASFRFYTPNFTVQHTANIFAYPQFIYHMLSQLASESHIWSQLHSNSHLISSHHYIISPFKLTCILPAILSFENLITLRLTTFDILPPASTDALPNPWAELIYLPFLCIFSLHLSSLTKASSIYMSPSLNIYMLNFHRNIT